MESLSYPLIHLPAPWDEATFKLLKQEAQDCFGGYDKPVIQISLISVGGIECQDLPMSGSLKESKHLKASPYLRYLLTCITAPLGRVCLFKPADTKVLSSPLYQNSAYPLFYQTLCLPVDKETFLIIEVRGVDHSLSDLYDSEYWHVYNQTVTVASAKQSLSLAKPQLDILQPHQVSHYIGTALVICKRYRESQGIEQACHAFVDRWSSVYAVFQNNYNGEWSYQSALNSFRQTALLLIRALSSEMTGTDRQGVTDVLQLIDTQLQMVPIPPQRINRKLLLKAKRRKQLSSDHIDESKVFDRPIFIVSAPRAGSTLLFETLTQFPEIWSTGEENHALFENIQGLHPKDHNFGSNRLVESDANETVSKAVKKVFISRLHNREQQYFLEKVNGKHPRGIRFLEKTPKNALRIPFLKALFPDALFIYLHRDYKSNVSSLIDGWRSHQFIAYKDMPGFTSCHWKFLLIPKWQTLHNRSIAEIAYQQWQQSNRIIQQDLSKLPNDCWMKIDYQDLISQPEKAARRFSDFAELTWDEVIQKRCENGLPVSRLTLSSPQANKWEKHQYFLEKLILNA